MQLTPPQKLFNTKNLVGIEKYQEQYLITCKERVYFSKSTFSFESREEIISSGIYNSNLNIIVIATKSKLITLTEKLEKVNEIKCEKVIQIFPQELGYLVYNSKEFFYFNGKSIEKGERFDEILSLNFEGNEMNLIVKEGDKIIKIIYENKKVKTKFQDLNNILKYDQGMIYLSDGSLILKEKKYYGLFQNPILQIKNFNNFLIILFKDNIITFWGKEVATFLGDVSFEEKIEKIFLIENEILISIKNILYSISYSLPKINSSLILSQSQKTKEYMVQEFQNQINVSNLLKQNFNKKDAVLGKWNYQSMDSLSHPNYVNEMIVKTFKQQNWTEFVLLLKTGIVSSKSGFSLIEKLIETQNYEILMECLEYVIDISEHELILLIQFIFNFDEKKLKHDSNIQGPIEPFLKKIISYPYFTDILLTKYLKTLSIDYFLTLFKFLKKLLFNSELIDQSTLWVRMLLDSKLNEILLSREILIEISLIQKIVLHLSEDQKKLNSIIGILKCVTEKRSIPLEKRNTNYKVKITYY